MKHMLAIVFAFAAAVALADPATYYVDAEHGSDDYDGKASYADIDTSVSPVKGPKKTLQAATALATATTSADQEGDTIYIYPGDYREGSTSTGKYRANLPAGCRLIGVGNKAEIKIHGSGTSWDNRAAEVDTGAMRCLYLDSWTLVKGVTLCDGRVKGNGGCCSVVSGCSGSYLVDCIITENYAAYTSSTSDGKGGALSGSNPVPIRCLIIKNASAGQGYAQNTGSAWNCVFDQTYTSSGYAAYKTTTYNCTFVGGGGSNREGTMRNCLANKQQYKATYDVDTVISTSLQLDQGYTPLSGSTAIDNGDDETYSSAFPASALVADQKYLDFHGNPRFAGTIDSGAVEKQGFSALVNVTDANDGLVVSGLTPGALTPIEPGVTSVTIARNNATVKHCEGIEVNGEFFSFTGESSDVSYTHVFSGTANETLNVTAVYSEYNQWYVATTGDDNNAGDTPYRAKRTLAGAMEIASLAANDVVHVAEGTYDSGEMWDETCSNRLYVTKAIGIVADGAREKTIIMGKSDDNATTDERGCTISSVRCVHLKARNSYIKGFTITGGRSIANGGGVNSTAGGTGRTAVIDCIITNNAANNSTGLSPQGGGVYETTCIGCYLDENYLNGKGGGVGGSAGRNCTYVNCHIAGGNIYSSSTILNCRIDNAAATSDSETRKYYNCVILKPTFEGDFINCLHTKDVPGLLNMFDESLSPKYGTLPVDYFSDGDDPYVVYTNKFPATWMRFSNVGYGGGQRIYNGKIDIGPVECDWRGAFAKALSGKSLFVTQASENVTTNAIAGITLSGGDSVSIEWPVALAGEHSFNLVVDGAGEAAATIDGAAVVPVDGVCSFSAAEADVGTLKRISVSFAGDGSATISRFSSPKQGLLLIIQ